MIEVRKPYGYGYRTRLTGLPFFSLSGDKIQDITGSRGFTVFVKLRKSTLTATYCNKPPVLDIEITGKSFAGCPDVIHFRFFVATLRAYITLAVHNY